MLSIVRRLSLALMLGMTALTGAWAVDAPKTAPRPAPKAAPKPAPYNPRDLEGTWTNAWLTSMEREDTLKTFIVPEAEAAAFDAKYAGHGKTGDDPLGQETTEFPEPGDRLARIRGQARSSWIYDPADGKIPYTDAVKAANKARGEVTKTKWDNPDDRPLDERCVGPGQSGPPFENSHDLNLFRIVQTAGALAIESEFGHNVRIIRLKGGHAPAAVRQWMGDSIGHWEGATLVVETLQFIPRQLSATPGENPGDTKVIERFTRTGVDEITYDFIVENPALYTQTWRGEMILRPAKGEIYEHACHEGNYGLEFILAGARQAETGLKVADVVGVVKAEAAPAPVAVTKAEKDATAGAVGARPVAP